jgi:hypothetical protein
MPAKVHQTTAPLRAAVACHCSNNRASDLPGDPHRRLHATAGSKSSNNRKTPRPNSAKPSNLSPVARCARLSHAHNTNCDFCRQKGLTRHNAQRGRVPFATGGVPPRATSPVAKGTRPLRRVHNRCRQPQKETANEPNATSCRLTCRHLFCTKTYPQQGLRRVSPKIAEATACDKRQESDARVAQAFTTKRTIHELLSPPAAARHERKDASPFAFIYWNQAPSFPAVEIQNSETRRRDRGQSA